MGLRAGDRRPARRRPRRRPAGIAPAGHRRDPVRGHGRRRQRDPARAADRPPRRRGRVPRPAAGALLTPDPDVRARLRRFGLRQIGAVAELPRSALVARFGAEGELLHDRARGVEVNPFRPRRAPERLALALPIEPAVAELDPLRFVLHRLAGDAGRPARGPRHRRRPGHLRLSLDLAFAPRGTPPELAVEQRFPEPTSDAEAIERLLFARLERTPPPAPVARVELELAGVEPAVGQQACRCSSRRRPATRGSAGSWRGSP